MFGGWFPCKAKKELMFNGKKVSVHPNCIYCGVVQTKESVFTKETSAQGCSTKEMSRRGLTVWPWEESSTMPWWRPLQKLEWLPASSKALISTKVVDHAAKYTHSIALASAWRSSCAWKSLQKEMAQDRKRMRVDNWWCINLLGMLDSYCNEHWSRQTIPLVGYRQHHLRWRKEQSKRKCEQALLGRQNT